MDGPRGTVHLELRVMQVLVELCRRAGEVVTRDELIERVWPGVVVSDDVLTRCVYELRRQLPHDGESDQGFIETLPKRGYRLNAVVQPLSPPLLSQGGRRRRLLIGGAAAVVMLVIAGVAVRWFMDRQPALGFNERDWVLVADFENQTGDPRFDRALFTALTVSLEQSLHANIYPRSRVRLTLERMQKDADTKIDEALAREICIRENLRGLVTATITRTGKNYAIALRLVDPQTGAAARAYLERAEGEDRILESLQTVATHLRRDIGETLPSISAANRSLAAVTTKDLQALRLYSDGVALWRAGRYAESVKLHEAAVIADPEFAMAHAALGASYYGSKFNSPDDGRKHYERALTLTERVTERERHLIEAHYASHSGRVEEAFQKFASYLDIYPDDIAAQFSLAGLLMRNGRCGDAVRWYTEIIRRDAANVGAYANRGACRAIQGDFAAAVPDYKRVFELEPGRVGDAQDNLYYEYATALFGAGKRQDARSLIEPLLDDLPGSARAQRTLALFDMYEGRLRSALGRFERAIAVNRSQPTADRLSISRDHLYRATVLAALGDGDAELRELDAAVRVLDQGARRPIEYRARIARAMARARAVARAQQLLDSVRKQYDSDRAADRSTLAQLEAEVEVARGNPVPAIARLESVRREGDSVHLPLLLDSLAHAFVQAGERDRAAETYRELVELPGGWLGSEGQQVWLDAHYELASLYADLGRRDEGWRINARLLEIWRDADPDLPMLRNALRLQVQLKDPTT